VTVRVLFQLTKPTPKTCARSSEVLDHQIDGAAYQQQGQTQINKYPPHYPQSQMGFFQAMAHYGLVLFTLAVGFEHAEILCA
jgi:hypothetical protein